MKQVIIDSEAEDELSEAVDFYERRVSGLGLTFARAAREAVEVIQADPGRHPPQEGGIWVLAFAHTSRKPGYWRQRL